MTYICAKFTQDVAHSELMGQIYAQLQSMYDPMEIMSSNLSLTYICSNMVFISNKYQLSHFLHPLSL